MESKGVKNCIYFLTGRAEGIQLDDRIFNITALFLTLLPLAGGILTFFNPEIPLHVQLFTFGLVGVMANFYYWGRFRQKAPLLTFPLCVILLMTATLYWFLNGGLLGQLPMGFFLIAAIGLGILPTEKHLPFLVVVGLHMVALILVQYQYPELLPDSRTDMQQFRDLVILFVASLTFVAGIFWYLKSNFEWERKQVLRKNEELSDFAHVVSHDMKAPLRGIQHLSQFVLEDNEETLDPASKDMLAKVVHSADRMTVLINDILTYTRMSENAKEKSEIDMNELVASIVSYLNPSPEITIRYSGLPNKIYYNRVALHQVIQNLISNAIKYNDKNNPLIEISSTLEGRFYWVSVKDNGPGIAPEHHEKVFEFLKTLGNKSRNESGTGIGLALVKKIIEQNDGKVKIDSSAGDGATFWVSIPA